MRRTRRVRYLTLSPRAAGWRIVAPGCVVFLTANDHGGITLDVTRADGMTAKVYHDGDGTPGHPANVTTRVRIARPDPRGEKGK